MKFRGGNVANGKAEAGRTGRGGSSRGSCGGKAAARGKLMMTREKNMVGFTGRPQANALRNLRLQNCDALLMPSRNTPLTRITLARVPGVGPLSVSPNLFLQNAAGIWL